MFVCFWLNSPPPQWARALSFTKFLDHTQSLGLLWTSDQLVAETSDNTHTQNSYQTNIHAPGGIRTHSLSRRAAADLRLRPRGHWDRRLPGVHGTNTKLMTVMFNLNICLIESFYPLRNLVC